ncbi:hypothetical protein KR044_005521 [Drosophila immigrans]|nr:hypothetical protein KR044_005521 [Drosophila immigrans]
MSLDDVIYVICLLACIGAGNYVKKIRDETQRKTLCSVLGILVVVVVSGFHSLHCAISVVLGTACVLLAHPSQCHLVTFGVMFGYLVFFRLVYLFGLPAVPGHTNMIQMLLTLKVSGIAFERNAAWKRLRARDEQQKNTERDVNSEPSIEITDYDLELQQLSATEILLYSFNYVGVLTGPYYRYRTYRDYFEMPFKDHAPSVQATIEQLKWAVFYCSLYLLANYIWPLDYVLSDEFYERSVLYRLLYVWPIFFVFRARIYTGLTLSECVCTMAGFGAYPEEADATNGEGPRKRYQHLKRDADKHSYNFTTIVNTRVWDVERCWTFREGMKHWNVCVQYWLAVNVYKLFPIKKYRTLATFLCSAYWHGFRPGHYFCIMGAPIYVPLEDMWNKLVRKDATGTQRTVIDVLFWICKWWAFSYLGTAFLLSSFDNIWRFYSSVYHIGYISWAVLVAIGLYLTKQKKAAERRAKRAADSAADASEGKQKAQ